MTIARNLTTARARFAMAVGAALVVASCSDATGVERRSRVTLSVAGAPATAATGTTGTSVSPAGLPIISGNGHVLDLRDATLTLGDVRLDRQDGRNDDDSDSDGRHRNDGVFHSGPTTVDIPLNGGVVTPLVGEIPFGTYDELEADLEYLRVRGTFDGQAFDVTIAIDRELALQLRPPLVVDADHDDANVTINADVMHCFRDASGTPIDPRRLDHDASLRAAFRDCIVRALRAHEDSDRDGDDEDSDSDSDTDR